MRLEDFRSPAVERAVGERLLIAFAHEIPLGDYCRRGYGTLLPRSVAAQRVGALSCRKLTEPCAVWTLPDAR